jgi:hypothetical protein
MKRRHRLQRHMEVLVQTARDLASSAVVVGVRVIPRHHCSLSRHVVMWMVVCV